MSHGGIAEGETIGAMSHVAVILAAGKSTRMRSHLPKVAHPLAGRPMLAHVLSAAAAAIEAGDDGAHPGDEPPLADSDDHSTRLVVVLGHEAVRVQQALVGVAGVPPYLVAVQQQQRGTGDAVRAAHSLLTDLSRTPAASTILVLYGDTPLVRAETLTNLLAAHTRSGATLSFLTGQTEQPADYGRVLRDPDGRVLGIVEARHATDEQRHITEVNSGIYCFAADWLWSHLPHLQPHTSGEYYLTDLVELAAREGRQIATVTASFGETAGVNDRIQLAEAATVLRRRILDDLMRSGVTVVDPASTFVDVGVRVGQDTTLQPFTTLLGGTVVGENCAVGPHSVVRDSTIGDGCVVLGSWVEEATMEAGSRIGPMSHLRPGAQLAAGANLGNFAEVKNALIGPGVQMHHFSYIGDATIGARSNVAAGVITNNWDGTTKHHTEVGEDVFIGCDTMLIAPVTLGDYAFTGAGSVVRRDVPPGGVAVGMPARVIRHRQRPAAPDTQAFSRASSPTTAPGEPPSATQEAQPPAGQRSAEEQAHPPERDAVAGTDTPSRPTNGQGAAERSARREGKESDLDG